MYRTEHIHMVQKTFSQAKLSPAKAGLNEEQEGISSDD
jgi:hypothetical protein